MTRVLRIALAAALVTGLIGLAGCKIHSDDLSDIDEGQSFQLGAVRWNVVYDRFLNQQQAEDAGYAGKLSPPAAGTQYFAVFVLVGNKTEDPQPLPDRSSFKITDTAGGDYTPIPSQSPFEFPYGSTLAAHGTVPDPDSEAASGPTQGAMILFQLSQDVTENRPLELHISSAGQEAVVKLDL